MNTTDVIIKPLISEKSVKQAEKGSYTFAVVRSANKKEIREAVHKTFNVDVTAIMTMTVKPGRKRVGVRRMEVDVSAWKKAIVSLKEGQKIDIFNLEA